MELEIHRLEKSDNGKATIGQLYIEGTRQAYTLEDRVRASGEKVPKETAIPAGRYRVIVDFSNRFQKLMPHVLNVPMFEGIRIHPGNTDVDTEGCILLGETHTPGEDFIGSSRVAFENFFPMLKAACDRGEECWLTITDDFS